MAREEPAPVGDDERVADEIQHPPWCARTLCTAHHPGGLLGPSGYHRSDSVETGIDWAMIRGEHGPVTGHLLQMARRQDAEVFLRWEIGSEPVGQIQLTKAGPIALLIATGLGYIEEREAHAGRGHRSDGPQAPST